MKHKTALYVAVSMAAMVTISGTAQAQNAAPADAGTANAEIVVTAQKRSENVQDVPISVAVVSEQMMEDNNVLTVYDLGRVATNFSATQSNQKANVRLAIRGIGSPSSTATEPSVAAFVDGVYVPRPGSIIGNFLDMEGVEVLRGPQGTLFGRNASVGALSFRTAQPTSEFSGEVAGEYGTGARYKLSGHVNIPLSENVAMRVAGMAQTNKGLWHNNLDGKTYGGSDDYAGRVTLKADLGSLTWVVRGDYAKSNGDGYGPTEFDYGTISAGQAAVFNGTQNAFSGTHTDDVLFDRNVNQVITADYKDVHWGVSSDASLDVGSFTFRLINSYRDWDTTQLDGDVLFTTIPMVQRTGGYTSKSQNHELQIISPQNELLGGKLDFVAGLYYFQEDYTIDEQLTFYGQFCNVLLAANAPLRAACNGALTAGAGVNGTNQDFAQSVESFAVYGQGNFHITDTLTFTLGGRWTKETKDGSYVQLRTFPFAASLRALENVDLALDDDRFTWRAGLNFKPSDDVMLFATYSTGYKSGGFNSGAGAVALNQTRVFDRETVENMEFGAKTEWLDGALTANITFYRMDIAGFQDRSFDGVSFVVRNAGELRHQGFEFDAVLRPVPNFSVNTSLAYLDSKFTDYPGGAGLPGCVAVGGNIPAACAGLPNGGQIQDLKGVSNNYAAKFTGNVGATWSGDIGSSGMGWSLNGNMAFISDINNGAVNDNNPQTVQDGYSLLSARFSIFGPDEQWSVSVYGSNLTDEGYCMQQFYQVLDRELGMRNGIFPGSTGVRCSIGSPRTYGVAGSFRF